MSLMDGRFGLRAFRHVARRSFFAVGAAHGTLVR
jgi:hypothetical protein